MKRERVIELWLAGFVLVAGLIVVVVLLGTAAADGPPMSERVPLSYSPIHNHLPTNNVYASGHIGVVGNIIKRNNFEVDPLCNEQDGCYPYGDGCEERDYYCMGDEEGCNYTSSNRHNDSWVDTGNTRWVDENECQMKEQKEQEYRDYKCSAGSCNYSINDTKWIDTGNTSIKANGTICGCTANNTVKRCYDGNCTDTGIGNASNCCADVACDGKKPGESCGDGRICNSTCNCVSLAPLGITSFAPLAYVDDTVGNWRTFNVTANQAANVSWYLNDMLVLTNESVLEAKCTLHADVIGEHNVTAIASNANGSDMQLWIWAVTELPKECEGTDTCCGCYPNCGNCNEQDGCYPYGDGCEERDYFCAGNGTACNYTSSNRHNDSWVDTGNTRWVDVNKCQEKEQREQEYRDYKCSAGSCNYSINDTKWLDTGIYNTTCNDVSLAPPEITSFTPLSYVDDTVGNWRIFNVTINQAANVSWYLNNTLVLTNESVLEAKCMLHADVVGEHNVTAIASNANGSDMQTWILNVTERLNCTCGDICVIPTGWWRDGGAFHPTDTPIQSAVDNAITGETICVKDGTYTENVDVDTQLTIRSENGAGSTTINALYSNDHVFEVIADYVSISGFTVNGVTDSENAGIWLGSNIDHCNIYDNKASENCYGIYLSGSSKYNAITGNTVSNNHFCGICLSESSNYNTITGNTVSNNHWCWCGIRISGSSYNTITSNIALGSSCGIRLDYSSNYNTITNNSASNNDNGICLYSTSNNNRIYNNYFNNKNNAHDDGSNIWNITKISGTNIIGGSWLGGNYWSDYSGIDANGDGLGDILLPYNSNGDILVGGDMHPLVPAGIAPLLSVEKTDDPDPVQAGGTLNYSIIVSNKGYVNASAVIVTETYDVNVTFESAIPVPSSGNDMWIFPALNANETKLINISVTVNPLTAMETVLHNTVNVSSAEGGTDSDTEATTVFSGEQNCTCGDICVITTGWWRNGGAFQPTDTPIQAAIDNAISGETICVKDGTYTENVDVDTQLTIRSENGAGSTTVNALYSNDHVFEVIADYVSILGFTVNGATGGLKAGIYLDSNIGHCNIYDNNASGNYYGIYLRESSYNNTITSNTVSNNDVFGIQLFYSSSNTISDNTASNNHCGIHLSSSSSNTIHSNTASNNDDGIDLSSTSNNNRIYNNYFNNKNNAQDDGTNIWNITKISGTNIIGGSWLGGNYWSDYAGIDANGDGLGDTLLPYNSNGDILVGGDMHPLVPAGIAPLLSVEKTDDPDPVQAGGTLNYSIIVSNKGYVNASAVIVTEIYDVNVTYDSAIPAPSSGNDMWIFPALNANETKRINISVTVNPLTAMETVLHNTVNVSCAEGVTDTDTEATTVLSEGLNCTCGDICVITTGWWRDGGAFHPSDTPIQDAIDNAIMGDTICVKDGTYTENVDVDTQLTIRSENGAASTTVQALNSDDHVFEVTADYVNIIGFTVIGATGRDIAGIYLKANNCSISGSNASNNCYGILLHSSDNNIIANNTVKSNNKWGIYLISSGCTTITNNIVINNSIGIFLYSSSTKNILTRNVANFNRAYGIKLSRSCRNNQLINNDASNNRDRGVEVLYSSDNLITSNNISNNNFGIYLHANNNTITNNTANSNDDYGIYLRESSNNSITGNTVSNNDRYGICLYSSSSNTISDNTASCNGYGIRLDDSNNNLVYNNYFNNTNNAYDDGINIWDITPTLGENIIGGSWLGGNYWSDYAGEDTTGDGLGDTLLPYNSNGEITTGGDWHPLVEVSLPDLIITEKWLCWPDNCTICYNITNIGEGTAPACHNTTLYVDGVAVAHDHVPVDLAPGESYIGCFDGYTWTYTPPSDNITVCADNNEAVDEFDETNNCVTNIWMCGDVNCDGKVTMSDVRKVFNRYLDPNYPLDLPWAADVNCDGKVTMSDVRKVFNRYLEPGYELNCCCGV